MEDALQRIAALASSLKEAELRILLELTRRANEDRQATQSTRQLAESTGLSRSNVTAAIHSLAERGLIQTDGGSATRASSYQLSFLETVLIERGPITGPPLDSKQAQGGLITGPPLYKERARARIDRYRLTKPDRSTVESQAQTMRSSSARTLPELAAWLHGKVRARAASAPAG